MDWLIRTLRCFHRLDRELTDRWLRRTFVHPMFWGTRLLRRAVQGAVPYANGVLLDVGCGLKPYESFFRDGVGRYWGMDYGPESGYRGNRADLYGDIVRLPVASGSVSTVLCTEVLEHVPDPPAAVGELFRILRAGGTVICTAPFLFPIHDARDYFRFTPDGLRALFEHCGFRVESVRPLGGSGASLAVLVNLYVHDICFSWTPWLYPLGVVLRPAIWCFVALVNALGGILDRLVASRHFAFNQLLIAGKVSPAALSDREGR